MEQIDGEVTQILQTAAKRAFSLLTVHREQLEIVTQALLRQEELDEAELTELIGPSVHGPRKHVSSDAEPEKTTTAAEATSAEETDPAVSSEGTAASSAFDNQDV